MIRPKTIGLIFGVPLAACVWWGLSHLVSGIIGNLIQPPKGWLSVANFTELVFAIQFTAPAYFLWWRWFRKLRPQEDPPIPPKPRP